MNYEDLTKIEINLPIKRTTLLNVFPKLVNFFIKMEGIQGCTHTTPSLPSIFMGKWYNRNTNIVETDHIIWIYACCRLKDIPLDLEAIINIIKEMIEKEGEEKLAWITYSSVCVVK